MDKADLKRKIRKLKKLENTLRIQNNIGDHIPYVWDKFFDLQETGTKSALYTLSSLIAMDKDEYKTVIAGFFARIYYEIYIHNGLIDAPVYDPALLDQLGLTSVADETDVKKRFRDLAKKYHPDTGGDPEKFIKLMNIYRELTK